MDKKESWLTFMTEEDYEALERFGFDLTERSLRGSELYNLEARVTLLQQEVDDLRAGEALRKGLSHYEEDGINGPEMSLGAGAGVATVATPVGGTNNLALTPKDG
jgi:hypothetical protein